MSQTKLETARELIQVKQYEAARAVLKTLPHDPTAQRWLKQLDERYPSAQQRSRRRLLNWLVWIFVVGVIAVGIAVFVKSQNDQRLEVYARIDFLLDCGTAVETSYGVTMQSAFSICDDHFWQIWKDDVLACYRQYENPTRRDKCLKDNGVPQTPY